MRVLLQVDMAGISGICDYRELWSPFAEYWTSGRQKTTLDVVAAAQGMLEAGVDSVTVCEIHGPVPNPIILVDQLPEHVEWQPEDEIRRELASGSPPYDGLFLLGGHARCGAAEGFASQTEGIDLRIAIDNKPVTEAHLCAWRAGLPLLGVTGSDLLEDQLDGVLTGTPFLAVKHDQSRTCSEPIFETAEQSSMAIQAFARWVCEHADERQAVVLPRRFTLVFSMRPQLADLIDRDYNLNRTSPALLAASFTDWWYEAEPAIYAAMIASFRPWQQVAAGIDDSDEETMLAQDPARLERLRQFWIDWVERTEPEWII